MTPRIFVTGATGLIGRQVVRHFLGTGRRVVMATSSKGIASTIPDLEIIPFDLSEPDTPTVQQALETCSALVHAAAVMPHDGDPADVAFSNRMLTLNVGGTFGLFQAAARAGVRQAVFVGGTAGHYDADLPEVREDSPPRAVGAYGLSKHLSELAAAHFDGQGEMRVASLRVSAPYGGPSRARAVVGVYIEQALAGKALEVWGTGARMQTFTHVRDIARACDLAISRCASGQYNVAGSGAISMKELAETVQRVVGRGQCKVIINQRPDPNEHVRIRVSIDKARQELGYEPQFNLEAGLRETVEAAYQQVALWSNVRETRLGQARR